MLNEGEQVEGSSLVNNKPPTMNVLISFTLLANLLCLSVLLSGTRTIASASSTFSSTRSPRHDGGAIRTPGVRPRQLEEVDLGTTLVAIKCEKGGVVIGADSRTSISGYVSHRYAHKIVPITTHCLVARSGSAADTQQLAQLVQSDCVKRQHRYGVGSTTVSSIAHYLRSLTYDVASNGNNNLGVSLIIAGCNPLSTPRDAEDSHTKGQIFTLASSGALLQEHGDYAASGSGSTIIMGFLDHFFQQRQHGGKDTVTLSEEEAIRLCQDALELAIQRDSSSGGVLRIYCCNRRHGIRQRTVYPATTTASRTTSSLEHSNDLGVDLQLQRQRHLPGFADSPLP